MSSPDLDAALARFRDFYATFGPAWLPRIEELYAPGFHFQDAFHTVHGDVAQLRGYFEKILGLAESRFVVEDTAVGGDGAYVRWRWEWRRRPSDPRTIAPGVTHLRFAPDGRIAYHRDHFDAAEAFYETLPVLGGVLRAIKRRI